MSDGLITCRSLLAMLVVAAPMLAHTAHAQQVVLLVNGEPITALDIEQRGKLTQMSTHKTPVRQDVIEELINEKLKVKEAKKWGLEITNSEVEQAYASMASRMRMTTDQLTQTLARGGVNPTTLKSRIRADMAWPQLVRGRFQSSLQIGEKAILKQMEEDRRRRQGLHPAPDPVHRPAGFARGLHRRAQARSGSAARPLPGL
jgi:peptidyl-prolyl cis-trans isomerase SurA